MTASRRGAPLEIYQDQQTRYGQHHLTNSLPTSYPVGTGAIPTNVILNPPPATTSFSPEKQSPKSSPLQPAQQQDLFGHISFTPPREFIYTDSPVKKQGAYAMDYPQLVQKPKKALFTTFPSTATDKENYYGSSLHSDSSMPRSDAGYGYPSSLKRGYSEDESKPKDPHRNGHRKKPKVVKEDSDVIEPIDIPEPEDMPVLKDDGTKPNHSYAQLIGMAILRAPNRRLTLSQIYKWISDTFRFYDREDTGWMNSIRHNLSLNKAFVKQERPKDDPGKGSYWTLKPGSEGLFVRDKNGRRAGHPEAGVFMKPMTTDSNRPSKAPGVGSFALPAKPARMVDSSKFPSEQELSSDATQPASDADLPDDEYDSLQMPPPSTRIMHSSPPQHIHSSPPVPSQSRSRATSPAPARHSAVNKPGNRKERRGSFRDSGFFSSIESSVTRGGHGPEGEVDRPVIKRGRAEEEIARIRSSSYDSPIKQKPRSVPAISLLANSSPLQSFDSFGMPPLTPNITFDPPARKAPPTISPNTHLRNHRDAIRDFVGTPAHGLLPHSVTNLHDTFDISPMFTIHDDRFEGHMHTPNLLGTDFGPDIYGAYDTDALWSRGSPVKQSARQRPMLQRATTSAGVLADITGGGANRLASPFRMLAPKQSGRGMLSPSKSSRLSPAVLHDDADDENLFAGVDLGSDGSDPGLDIFKGFSKIGADVGTGKENDRAAQATKQARSARPALERALTSRF